MPRLGQFGMWGIKHMGVCTALVYQLNKIYKVLGSKEDIKTSFNLNSECYKLFLNSKTLLRDLL